jgi:hypothetical protein
MSVEQKIRELLAGKQAITEETSGDQKNPKQGDSVESSSEKMGASKGKDTSKSSKAQISGDANNPRQGSSQDAPISSERDQETDNPGAKEASPISSNQATISQGGAGDAPNFTTYSDPTSVVNQASSKGNVHQEEYDPEEDADLEEDEVDYEEDELEEEVDFTADLAALFDGNQDLSEEFRGRAASLFEAMVVARVTNEITAIEESLIEQSATLIEEYKSELVEKIDSYLGYVAEQWVDANEVAVENTLRSDIAESFISGLKNLFAEHYIDVPEEKYDVLGEMQAQIDELASRLDETLAANVELHASNVELQKDSVITVVAEDLAKTDAEKLRTLVADVEFENADIFEEKLNVIKENYFPKNKPLSEERLGDGYENEFIETSSAVTQYVKALDAMAAKN